MGLDIVPLVASDDDRVSFSYGGFADFRRKLAAAIGIDLDKMVGFGGEQEWPSPEEEPLVFFLDHSDSDGELDWHACDRLAPRFREVAEKLWPSTEIEPGTIGPAEAFYGLKARELADLFDAVSRGDYRMLDFS